MATRFRLPSAGAPTVSPALQSYTHNAPTTLRTAMVAASVGDASALGTEAYAPDSADHIAAGDSLLRQFVSAPMAAGNVFTSGDVLKYAVQCLESNAGNNLQLQLFVGVVSEDGNTARATIRSKVLEGTEMGTAIINRFLSTTLSGSYTTVDGDRLVVEFSCSGTPVATGGVQGHNASIRTGSDGAGGDLPENDTEVGATFNPWIEFATTITWKASGRGVLLGGNRNRLVIS